MTGNSQSKKLLKAKTFNIFTHSICFLLLFTAFQTSTGISQRALTGYSKETENATTPFEKIDGYISNGILYIFFALFNWVAPIVISFTRPRYAMVIGASTYAIYVATYIQPVAEIIYIASAVIGCGAAVIWTAQGVFLTENSDDDTLQKNSGIFWSFLQSAMIWGNLYIYFNFKGVKTITSEQRKPLYWIFTILCSLGTVCLLLTKDLKKYLAAGDSEETKETVVSQNVSTLSSGSSEERNQLKTADPELADVHNKTHTSLSESPKEETVEKCKRIFNEAVTLFQTKNMLIICLTFLYTGVHQSFWTGVYPTIIGGCKHFGEDSDKFIGINGIVMGLGQVLGGLIFSIFPALLKGALTKEKIVLIGGSLHLISFALIFMNFGQTSPLAAAKIKQLELTADTSGAYWEISNYPVSILTAFLLGFGDCCFNTQLYSYLGWYYKANSAPAFALFKSVQSIACAISFFYAGAWTLSYQLIILVIFDVVSVGSFIYLNKSVAKERKMEESENLERQEELQELSSEYPEKSELPEVSKEETVEK